MNHRLTSIFLLFALCCSPLAAATFDVLSIESSPPSNPSIGDTHIVGKDPTSSYTGHESDIATLLGLVWGFETPDESDTTYDLSTRQLYLFVDDELSQGGLWLDSKWKNLTGSNDYWTVDYIDSSVTLANEDLGPGKLWVILSLSSSITITLPQASENLGNTGRFYRKARGSSTITFAAEGGSTVFDSPTLNDEFGSITLSVIDGVGWGVID
jgi:hypothetical protein